MRNRTKFCAVALALAIATPVAISQAPAPASTAGGARLLPSTAAAYADYQGEVSNIMVNSLSDAAEVDQALEHFAAPNVDQLSSSWLSYSAILAAQNPEFVKGVRDIDNYYGRERLMLGLERDLGYATTLGGGNAALQTVLASTSRDKGRISSAGAFVKEQSYTMQNFGWAKKRLSAKENENALGSLRVAAKANKPVTDAVQKLFAGPDLNAMLASVATAPESANSLWDKVSVIAVSAPGKAFSSVSPVTVAPTTLEVDPNLKGTANRMMTLAAMHTIDADKSNADQVTATMKDPTTTSCLEAAQIEMFGCVSATATRYEHAFCLARYGLRLNGDKNRSIAGCVTTLAK
ncbi:MAG: hypothetical protein ABMA14_25245 [Hyphomonadaceae bacterium]